MYRIEVENEQILTIINQSDICFAKLDTDKRINLLALAHIYISTKQTILFNDFVFDMMTDGISEDMGVPSFVLEEVASTNGRIYFDRQVFQLVRYICRIYDKKELARLIYCQPANNKLFELLVNDSIQCLNLKKDIAIKLATEICRFPIKELAIERDIITIAK